MPFALWVFIFDAILKQGLYSHYWKITIKYVEINLNNFKTYRLRLPGMEMYTVEKN